nr:TolC family protein [Belnapia moabensis]
MRSLSTQAFEQYLGYAETRRSTQLSLVSQVANAWLAIAADQALLDLTRATLKSQEEGYQLTRASFDGSKLDSLPFMGDVPEGLSSDLLLRRPDVLAAEHNLIAASYNIGPARAAFFPSISLTSSYGTASNGLQRLDLRARHQHPDLQRRHQRRHQPRQSPARHPGRAIRAGDPDRLPRGRRRIGRPRHP